MSRKIAFCLSPGFSLFAVASALDVLRHANRFAEQAFYSWSALGEADRPVPDGNDIPFTPDRKNFWEKRHHHMFGSAGTAKQVSQGGSQVQNKRDFPQEFLDAYAVEVQWAEENPRWQRVIQALQQHDIEQPVAPVATKAQSGIKPLWYYRHYLKSIWRRYFPESMPVVD